MGGASKIPVAKPAPLVVTYSGSSSSTNGVIASTARDPVARQSVTARYTRLQSAAGMTVSTMAQNTGPGGATARPATRVCSEDGVRQVCTTAGGGGGTSTATSSRTIQVTDSHPSAANV